jgi:lipopolysaccharide export system permease protein
MGKGLSTFVILELLFYVSASLIPLALPLAVLLSSIMTIGNLTENNELTALKASGLSLYRILRPLTFSIIVIAAFTLYFSNYIIPVANLKWHSLIYDIQNTKIASLINPGVYSFELEGYAIKVDSAQGNSFKGILIHDHTNPNELKTIRAKEGTLYKTVNGKNLFFELQKGTAIEELSIQSPSFDPKGNIYPNVNNKRPARQSEFEKATYKIQLDGFSLKRSQDELFADKHEMLNVFQIYDAVDSVQKNGGKTVLNFVQSYKYDHPYFQAINFKNDTMNGATKNLVISATVPKNAQRFSQLSDFEKNNSIASVQSKLRRQNENLLAQFEYMKSIQNDVDSYWIEFHKKFALTYAIIVLFFVGAPLGAIVKKGGFGAPVVFAALLFLVYFVLISTGESLATSQVVSPFVGMWLASLILTPIALLLTRAAANDSPIFDASKWKKILLLFKKKNAITLHH